jgi:hypothetical protein
MILQMVWNECLRFGGHINIQVSYKILWSKVPNFAQYALLSTGADLRQFWTQRGH